MKRAATAINRYLARLYAVNLLLMTAALWGVMYLFDTVELLRRAGKENKVSLALVLKMGLLQLPDIGQTILLFAILFSAMLTFWQLNRRQELIIMRAAGLSVWQFLTPVIGVTLVAGLLATAALNPLSALLQERFQRLESAYLNHEKNNIALFDEGLWLRQEEEGGYIILHAAGVKMPEWQLRKVMVLYFGSDDSFRKRLDAETATLGNGAWVFNNAIINSPDKNAEKAATTSLQTKLTPREIEDSFSSPRTMSFWRLPAFIRTMESTGFDASRLKVRFYALIAQPLLFVAMILLAAAVCLRPPRQRGTLLLIIAGIFSGFVAFFMASFLQALGASHQIPIFLAAWAPSFVLLLLGVTVLLNLEDG